MYPVIFTTVAFWWKRAGQWQCTEHESMHLNPEQVEPYIERVCEKAVNADIQIAGIEVRNHIPPNKWGQPQWQVPWSWHTKLPL